MGQWANGPMGQWANGPMGQWANGPMGQWANGTLDAEGSQRRKYLVRVSID